MCGTADNARQAMIAVDRLKPDAVLVDIGLPGKSGLELTKDLQALHPEMKVMLSMHEGTPISIVLPQKVVLEVTETEPTTKGQTASSSYKPAVLSNGVLKATMPSSRARSKMGRCHSHGV